MTNRLLFRRTNPPSRLRESIPKSKSKLWYRWWKLQRYSSHVKNHTGPGSLAMNVQTVKKARASDRTEKAASPCRKSLISCCCTLDRVVLLLLLTPMPRDSTVPCNKTVVDPLGFASLRNALLGALTYGCAALLLLLYDFLYSNERRKKRFCRDTPASPCHSSHLKSFLSLPLLALLA